jgi:hypothetical protein
MLWWEAHDSLCFSRGFGTPIYGYA